MDFKNMTPEECAFKMPAGKYIVVGRSLIDWKTQLCFEFDSHIFAVKVLMFLEPRDA
jgi:hypothetical protein